jgi:hypothetical protein
LCVYVYVCVSSVDCVYVDCVCVCGLCVYVYVCVSSVDCVYVDCVCVVWIVCE